jgi:hypothetical protein
MYFGTNTQTIPEKIRNNFVIKISDKKLLLFSDLFKIYKVHH